MKSNLRWWPLVAVFVLFMVNLPLGHSMWTNHRLDSAGLETRAEVVSTNVIPRTGENRRFYVTWRFDEDVDSARTEYTAEVTEATQRAAEADDVIAVEYLPGKPAANRPVGRAPTGKVAMIITLGGNFAIVALIALMFWVRRATRFEVLATADVVRCKPPEMISEMGDEVVIRGEVTEIDEGQIVVMSRGRRITVVLGEFSNAIGYQQYAEVRGRRID